MVEVASMSVGVGIDTSVFERGIRAVKTGLNNVRKGAMSVGADLIRAGSFATDFVTRLGQIGSIGVGALAAIAKQSPLLAPVMAKLDVTFFKLSNTLAQVLGPAFEKALEYFTAFANWVEANKEPLGRIVEKILDVGESILNFLMPPLEAIAGWALENPELFGTIAAGIGLITTAVMALSAVGLSGVLGGLAGSLGEMAGSLGLGGLAGILGGLGLGALGVTAMRATGADKALETAGSGLRNIPGGAGLGDWLGGNDIVQGGMGLGKMLFEDIPDMILGKEKTENRKDLTLNTYTDQGGG